MGKANKEYHVDLLNISPFVRYIHHLENANSNNYYIPWRYIYDYELIFVVDGHMTVMTDNDIYVLSAGDVHIMSPMIRHRRCIEEGDACNYYSIHFDFIYPGEENDFSPKDVYIAYCNRGLTNAPIDQKLATRPLYLLEDIELPKRQKVLEPNLFIETLNQLCQDFHNKPFAYEIDMKMGMLMLFKLILTDTRTQIMGYHPLNTYEDKFAALLHYLHDHMGMPVSIEALCRLYGYSAGNFRKLFKQKIGKSPNEYLINIRMERAAKLLATKEYSVKAVSEMVGYPDSHYFSRLFKQKMGVMPSSLIKETDD